jgi:hypothetical protein
VVAEDSARQLSRLQAVQAVVEDLALAQLEPRHHPARRATRHQHHQRKEPQEVAAKPSGPVLPAPLQAQAVAVAAHPRLVALEFLAHQEAMAATVPPTRLQEAASRTQVVVVALMATHRRQPDRPEARAVQAVEAQEPEARLRQAQVRSTLEAAVVADRRWKTARR